MDKIDLEKLASVDEVERTIVLMQLQDYLEGQQLIPIIDLLMKRFQVSANQLAISAEMDISALHKILNEENRQFKASHVDALLDDLESLGKLINPVEKQIWRRALRIASFLHFELYKAVEPRLREVSDISERRRLLAEFLRSQYPSLGDVYDKTDGRFPALIPIYYAIAYNVLRKWKEEESSQGSNAIDNSAPSPERTHPAIYKALRKRILNKYTSSHRSDSGDPQLLSRGSAITKRSLNNLLSAIDTHRGKARKKYKELRQATTTYFAWKGISLVDNLAHETIRRLIKKIEDEAEIDSTKIDYIWLSIARSVYIDYLKAPLILPKNIIDAAIDICFNKCIQRLTDRDCEFINKYYLEKYRYTKESGIRLFTVEHLRERLPAHRIEQKLEEKVNICLKELSINNSRRGIRKCIR